MYIQKFEIIIESIEIQRLESYTTAVLGNNVILLSGQ